jgi:formylglycine-generating enzyme required for sulfatase activity
MVVLAPGRFIMGSPDSDHQAYPVERPPHEVRITRGFALGRYPVTFSEYDEFCTDTNRHPPNDEGWGRGRRPVMGVSWADATAYCRWLSQRSGQEYRLPSEAEWEYACRAGTATRYPWGDDFRKDRANGPEGGPMKTTPVGEYPPNPWGLFDMNGNVMEWVQDPWHQTYEGATDDGSAWIDGNPTETRVLRGGSWLSGPRDLRAASRFGEYFEIRDDLVGFRVARTDS